MPGIFQGDIIIKRAIELGIEDMRKNPWLIDHMMDDLVKSPYFDKEYGQKQIDACKEWFKRSRIGFYMSQENGRNEYPCITIEMGSSNEKQEMKTMADQSTESEILLPNKIGKKIPYVVKPFVPTGYDISSGTVSLPDNLVGIDDVAEGMILVDPTTGNGYPIEDINADGIVIEAGLPIEASELAVLPMNQFYKARVEHTFFQETYNIGCHAHGDPQSLMFLHSIVLYSLLRYRESLFEANGFTETTFSNSPPGINPSFSTEAEVLWSRTVSISGQVENSWIKTPRRVIENVALREKTATGFKGGIKIISNFDPPEFIDEENELWYTIEGEE